MQYVIPKIPVHLCYSNPLLPYESFAKEFVKHAYNFVKVGSVLHININSGKNKTFTSENTLVSV
jgi:hypothetical protein